MATVGSMQVKTPERQQKFYLYLNDTIRIDVSSKGAPSLGIKGLIKLLLADKGPLLKTSNHIVSFR